MPVSSGDYAQILANWGWTQGSDPDFPLSEFKPTDSAARNQLTYTKGFKMHHMLMKELGPRDYLVFVRRLTTNRKFDAEHIIRELEATRSYDWLSFLSGWLIRGSYSRFSPASFRDTDGDGLVDIDEAYAGTNPNRMDTDGDGYSDSYEIARGFDPLSRKSRPSPEEPAIDGVAELIGFEPEAELSDARGEAEQGDIASMAVYKWDSKYYVRVNYFTRPAPSVVHTLHLRTAEGRHFWIQTTGARPETYWVSEFLDNVPFEQWKKHDPNNQPKVQIAAGEVVEFLLDLAEFKATDTVWFQYISGGRKGGQEIWNADETQSLAVALSAAPIRFDGIGADFLSVLDPVGLSDPRGDCRCDSNVHDIKGLHAARRGDWLYVLVTFHNDIRLNEHLPLTLHVRFAQARRNFWVQTPGSPSWFWVGRFADATPFERWGKEPASGTLRSIAFARHREFEVRIPWRLFAGTGGPAAIMAIVGSSQGGRPEWNADETGWLTIPER